MKASRLITLIAEQQRIHGDLEVGVEIVRGSLAEGAYMDDVTYVRRQDDKFYITNSF